MKTITLPLCALFMFCALAVAQEPTPTPPSKAVQPISENYVVSLTMTNKEKKTTEMSLVVASAEFSTSFPDSQSNVTSFHGTLTPEDGGTISIKYILTGEIAVSVSPGSVQYKSIATQTTVRLKLGDPVQILKSGTQTCTLSVSRLSDQHAQGK